MGLGQFGYCPGRFPNIGQTCYMNSSLQSLLALTDFMNDISSTEKDWGNFPGAKMLKVLLRLRNSHASRDLDAKIKLLLSFKMAVVMNAPGFMGNLQHVSLAAVDAPSPPRLEVNRRLLLLSGCS